LPDSFYGDFAIHDSPFSLLRAAAELVRSADWHSVVSGIRCPCAASILFYR